MKEMHGIREEDCDDEAPRAQRSAELHRSSTEPYNIGQQSSNALVPHSTSVGEMGGDRQMTPFERLSRDLSQDHRIIKEITLGKRIGFYRIRGELGSGNFSQVKLGIHALTKGE